VALNYTVGMLFQAKDMASEVMRRLEKQFGSLGAKAKTMAGQLALSFAAFKGMELGVDIGKEFFKAAEHAGRFEQRLAQLKVSAQGADANFMGLARSTALTAAFTSRSSPSMAAEAMRELAKAGLEAKEVLDMVNPALVLTNAAAGEINAKQAAEFMAQMRNTFAMVGAPSPELTVNVAAKVALESMADLADVPGMFSRVARGALPMKQNFSDVAAALSLVRKVVTENETAATSLGMVYQVLSTQSGMEKFFKRTGVSALDAAGNFKSITVILGEMLESPAWRAMASGSGGEANEFIKKLFGARQVTAVQAMLSKLTMGIKDANGQLVYGAEAARIYNEQFARADKDKIVDQYAIEDLKTLGGVLDFISTKIDGFKTTIGLAFVPIAKAIITPLNSALREIGLFLTAIPDWVKTGFGSFAILALALGVVTLGATAAFLMFSALAPLFMTVAAALWGILWPPLLAIGIIMTVLTAMGAAFYAGWQQNMGGFASSVGQFVDQLLLVTSALKQLFAEGKTWGDVDKKLFDPSNSGVLNFVSQVWMWLNRIKHFGESVWEAFSESIRESGMVDIVVELFGYLMNLFGLAKTSVGENVNSWNRWAEAGRVVGQVIAFIAKMGLGLLIIGMGILNGLVATLKVAWWALGPAIMAIAGMVGGLIEMIFAALNLNWDKFTDGLWTLVKNLGSFILNLFGIVFRLGAGVIGDLGTLFGKKWGTADALDKTMREATSDIEGATFIGAKTAGNYYPAAAAQQGQIAAVVSAPPPVVNVQNHNVSIIDGREVAAATSRQQHSDVRRSLMARPAAPSMVER
jgi:TP901 family phage tail tape measure protein